MKPLMAIKQIEKLITSHLMKKYEPDYFAAEVCNLIKEVEKEKNLTAYTEDTLLTFGKYTGHKISDILKEDPDYLLNYYNYGNNSFPFLTEYVKNNLDFIKKLTTQIIPVKITSVNVVNTIEPTPEITCKKYAYATEKLAKQHLRIIRASSDRKTLPVRVYECSLCSMWHLTSIEDPITKKFKQIKTENE